MIDVWGEKSDKETLQKQIDLDNLKTARAKDLEKYQNLARTVSLMGQIQSDDTRDFNVSLFGLVHWLREGGDWGPFREGQGPKKGRAGEDGARVLDQGKRLRRNKSFYAET